MKRIAVESSNIASIGYNPSSETLEVEFNTGQVYQYDNVPQSTYANLITAESKGEFFGKYVRTKFKYKKV